MTAPEVMQVGEELLDCVALGPGVNMAIGELSGNEGFVCWRALGIILGSQELCCLPRVISCFVLPLLIGFSFIIELAIWIVLFVFEFHNALAEVPAEGFELEVPGELLAFFALLQGIQTRVGPNVAYRWRFVDVYVGKEPRRDDRAYAVNLPHPRSHGMVIGVVFQDLLHPVFQGLVLTCKPLQDSVGLLSLGQTSDLGGASHAVILHSVVYRNEEPCFVPRKHPRGDLEVLCELVNCGIHEKAFLSYSRGVPSGRRVMATFAHIAFER